MDYYFPRVYLKDKANLRFTIPFLFAGIDYYFSLDKGFRAFPTQSSSLPEMSLNIAPVAPNMSLHQRSFAPL